ncbi:MAG: 3-oxoadipate enol-lactonase [Pseudomonadota bacterium]
MPALSLSDVSLHYREDGDPDGAPLVFANSLGTDLTMWDAMIAHLPPGLRIIRYDKRGHGQSSVPNPPYTMGALVRDVERLLDALEVRGAMFVGLSIGGLIGQGLAAKRLDIVRALVLSNTAAKIGTREMWQTRIDALRTQGLDGIAPEILTRWFSRDFLRDGPVDHWRAMLTRQPLEGYIGCAEAIAGTDFYTSAAALRLPVLGIAGSEDGATPSDLVRETINLIPGARFELMRRAGHLPCVEQPEVYAQMLTDFLRETGHIGRARD